MSMKTVLCVASPLLLLVGCTIVQVRDAADGEILPDVSVQIDPPPWPCTASLCEQSLSAVTNTSGIVVFTPADPSDIDSGHDLSQFVPEGWRRFELSSPGYDTVVEYRDHRYTDECLAYHDGEPTLQPCRYHPFELRETAGEDYVLLPDLVPIPTDLNTNSWTCVTLDLDEDGTPTDHRILRVSAGAFNGGQGPLEIYGVEGETAWQRLYRRSFALDGDVDTGGCIVWHPLHEHLHFGAWIALRLIARTPECAGDEPPASCVVAEQAKLSYEPRDTTPVDVLATLLYADYLGVAAWELTKYPGPSLADGMSVDGMTPGWGDTYGADFPSQYIRVPPSVPGGVYTLEVEVNPEQQIVERSLDNNRHRITVTIPDTPPGPCLDCTDLTAAGCPQYALEDVGECG